MPVKIGKEKKEKCSNTIKLCLPLLFNSIQFKYK